MNDTDCTVTSRFATEAFTPAYHDEITVRIIPNASTAIAIPNIVSIVRSTWRRRFFSISFTICIISFGLLDGYSNQHCRHSERSEESPTSVTKTTVGDSSLRSE